MCHWELLSELFDSPTEQGTLCHQELLSELIESLINQQISCKWELLSELNDSWIHWKISCIQELLQGVIQTPWSTKIAVQGEMESLWIIFNTLKPPTRINLLYACNPPMCWMWEVPDWPKVIVGTPVILIVTWYCWYVLSR